MRYFLLFTIALCSMNLYSQEALKERRYISEDGDMVILNDKTFLFVVYQSSHQPTWWSDTLAICIRIIQYICSVKRINMNAFGI